MQTQTFRRRIVRGLTGLVLAMGASLAVAHEHAVQVAVPPSSSLYGTIRCANDARLRTDLQVHVKLDQRASLSATPLTSATSSSLTPVFEADLRTTGHDPVSVNSEHQVHYVREVTRKEHETPVVKVGTVTEGVGVTVLPLYVDPDQGKTMVHLMMDSVWLNALRNVDTEAGVPIQTPDVQHDSIVQTVTLKVGETQDLTTPNGVLHLTLTDLSTDKR